jgi:hypothetical protein
LLCIDGTRKPVDQSATCHWGIINSHIVMTSAIIDEELRNEYKMLLGLLGKDFGMPFCCINILSNNYLQKSMSLLNIHRLIQS